MKATVFLAATLVTVVSFAGQLAFMPAAGADPLDPGDLIYAWSRGHNVPGDRDEVIHAARVVCNLLHKGPGKNDESAEELVSAVMLADPGISSSDQAATFAGAGARAFCPDMADKYFSNG